jgi:hypothetical protein
MTTHEADRPADLDSIEEYEEPVEDEPGTTSSRVQAVDEDSDGAEDIEPAEPDGIDAAAADGTPESDPVQKLAPVGPDTAMDPGTGSYQDRWGAIQAGFIDDPGRTVEGASALLAEIWDDIERSITDEREGVESRWQSTESSTDDLRVVMQDYRVLYDRFMRFASN